MVRSVRIVNYAKTTSYKGDKITRIDEMFIPQKTNRIVLNGPPITKSYRPKDRNTISSERLTALSKRWMRMSGVLLWVN